MFIKTLLSLFLAHILLLGGINTKVYTSIPEPTPITPTTTQKVSTTTLVLKKPEITKTATSTVKTKPKTTEVVVKTEKVQSPAQTVAVEPAPDFETINTNARKTIVNILCTTKYGDLSPVSGTGVIVANDGLILTNAHVGQYLLLKDFTQKNYIQCVARTGSPAYPKYHIKLVYISPDWVAQNKSLLKEQNPQGTGEHDFAFLKITDLIDSSKMPEYFNFIEPNTREIIQVGEPVLLASYPAGFLGGLSILQDLNITSAITQIQDVFTFGSGSIDVVSVGGTVVSQKGSSGGLVVDKNTSLIGIISTSSDGDSTKNRGLNAITLSHINRSLEQELHINLRQFLSQNHDDFAEIFASTTAPTLTKLISDELLKK